MLEVHNNVLDQDAVQDLVSYFFAQDGSEDSRPDVTSKSPIWNQTIWPQHHVKKLLDQILQEPYEVEECLFHLSNYRYQLHADTNWGEQHQKLYKVVLIPLHIQGPVGTCFFKNTWTGQSAKFTKAKYLPWSYTIKDKNNQDFFVEDLREFLSLLQTPEQLPNFDVTEQLVQSIQHLIESRSPKANKTKLAGRHVWVSDYADVGGITDKDFPEHTRTQYCSHIASEDLHGFTFDKFVPWEPGSVMVFDRIQIHSSGNGELNKLGLTIFTNKIS